MNLAFRQRQLWIGAIARHAQVARGIPATRGPHGIHEHLVPLIEYGILAAAVLAVLAPAPAAVVNLVHRLQHQKFAFVLEVGSNLRPHRPELCLDNGVGRIASSCRLDVQPMLAVGPVVVDVDQDLQSGLLGIIHHLSHTGQPCLVQDIVGRGTDMSQPGDRDAHGGEARSGQAVEQGLSHGRIAPRRVRCHTVVEGIILVAQVPAQSQPIGHLGGTAPDGGTGIGFALVHTFSTGGHTQHKKYQQRPYQAGSLP